ncbi:MAG: PAS domain S-box protein [Pseudomonadota bacterium]
MMQTLYNFLFGTLRGRLIISVAAVHAVMMALFIVDLTVRQRSMLLDRQIEEATALSQALATSAAGWLAANDVAGLQEIVEVQRRYPELLFAILVDEEGRVLASTKVSEQGQYMLDLPREAHQKMLSRTPALVDVATPAMIGQQHVGWARIGIGQAAAGKTLAEITRNGVIYALAAILIGSVIAWFMGRKISRRLYAVQETIDAVRAGNHLARSALAGDDESAVMAREFNAMLDALAERDAELRAGEGKYRSLIGAVQAAIVVHDGQGHILTSNPLAQELLGLSEDQLLGRALIDPQWHFLREEGSIMPVAEYPVSLVLSSRQPLRDYVTGISHPDRDEVGWALVNAEPEYNAAGAIEQVIVSFIDITERKRAEKALRESEERYRLVFENSPVSIWEEDFSGVKRLFDGLRQKGVGDIETYFAQHPETLRQCADLIKIVDVNRAALALHGAATKAELLAGLVDTFTPASFDTFRQELVCLWNGGTAMNNDAVVQTLAGDPRNVSVYFSVGPGHEQTLDKVLVSLVDITERKQIENALSASEAELRTLINAMTDIIIVSNAEGRYLKIVDTRPSLLYKPPIELLGKTLHEVFPKDQADFFLNHIKHALDTQQSVNFEYRLPVGNNEIWFNATISPISDHETLMVARDISDRKQAEEKLSRYRDQLEALVRARTAELEATNKELEAFAYSVSHDLRSPLRHIDGFLVLLQKKAGAALDDQSRHYMDTISDSAKKMGLLIDDLLAFSRMGRHSVTMEPADLGDLVREAIREFEPDVAGRDIDWWIGDLPSVTGDASMLRIVMTNLIANALKFTKSRQKARIEIGALPGQEAEAVIFVRDNGVGFDMAYADKLFGVFQRLHRAEEFEGTGIGLANVHRIIARHGGRTWAEGKVNYGATFYFALPSSGQGS